MGLAAARVVATPVRTLLLALALSLMAGSGAQAQFTPIERQEPCEAWSGSEAVFVGVASAPVTRRVTLPEHPPIPMKLSPVTVEHAYKGVTTPVVYVTPLGIEQWLTPGERYLVYGRHYHAPPHIVMASPGIGATPVGRASADLAFLDAMSSYARGGTLSGVVRLKDVGAEAAAGSLTPLEGIKVTIGGDDVLAEAITGGDGRFAVTLPAGSYRVTTELPPDLVAWTGSMPIEATIAEGGCARLELDTRFNGRVRGVLRGPDGNPLTTTSVDLVPADIAPDSTGHIRGMGSVSTNADGEFEFSGRPSGRYLLGVNLYNAPNPWAPSYPRTYYPGTTERDAAEIVVVERGVASEGFDFAVPPELPKGEVAVRVVASRPGALTYCFVELEDLVRRRITVPVEPGSPHRQPVVASLRYEIHAHLAYPGGHLESAPVVFTATTDRVTVTLTPDRPRSLHR